MLAVITCIGIIFKRKRKKGREGGRKGRKKEGRNEESKEGKKTLPVRYIIKSELLSGICFKIFQEKKKRR